MLLVALGNEFMDLFCAHVFWVAFFMEDDVAFDPVY
jgi:hypothetical protein